MREEITKLLTEIVLAAIVVVLIFHVLNFFLTVLIFTPVIFWDFIKALIKWISGD